MPLTDVKVRNLRPSPTVYRAADANGLCIEVRRIRWPVRPARAKLTSRISPDRRASPAAAC